MRPKISTRLLLEFAIQLALIVVVAITSGDLQSLLSIVLFISLAWSILPLNDLPLFLKDLKILVRNANFSHLLYFIVFSIFELLLILIFLNNPQTKNVVLLSVLILFWALGGLARFVLEVSPFTRISQTGFTRFIKLYGRAKFAYFLMIIGVDLFQYGTAVFAIGTIVIFVFGSYLSLLDYAGGFNPEFGTSYKIICLLKQSPGLSSLAISQAIGLSHEQTIDRLGSLSPKFVQHLGRKYYLSNRSGLMN